MDVKLAAGLAGAVRRGEVAGFCRTNGISRETFYKWRRRAEAAGGVLGLEEQSRRPLRSPGQTSFGVEEAIVRVRKELDELGWDNGPWSVRQHLLQRAVVGVPSEATIWRILVRRGLITPEPKKRPKNTWHRFVWGRPNDLWQIDATHWALADGRPVEIINIIDDHSRVCPRSLAVSTCTSPMAWKAMEQGAAGRGLPARLLSDNGVSFNQSRRNTTSQLEENLRKLGVLPIASMPFHPQTCGKVERFHQTMKKWLAKQPPARSLRELQSQLDRFVHHYNYERPHRSLNGRTPAAVWSAMPAAMPAGHPITDTSTIVRTRTSNSSGNVALGRRHTIGLGTEYSLQSFTVMITGQDCAIFQDGRHVRSITINPDQKHYPVERNR